MRPRTPTWVVGWLDRAYAQRDTGLPMLKNDPMFRNLKGDPRWRAFLEKMKLDG